VIENFPFPLNYNKTPVEPDGNPTRENCDKINNNYFPAYDATWACSSSLGRVYNNYNGLLDKMSAYWAEVARNFVDSPFVIGFELMNEPFPGDIYPNVFIMIPPIANRFYLQPFYNTLNKAIRAVDKKHLVFFQPVTWESFPFFEYFGFSESPGGEDYKNKSVLAFHNSVDENL